MASIKDFYKAELINAEGVKGKPLTLKIEGYKPVSMPDKEKGDVTCIHLNFVDEERELRLNLTNARTLARMFGEEMDDWVGKSITVVHANTQFGVKTVPCVRIIEKKK